MVAYQVSGEYAMIQAAAQNGWLDGEKTMFESLIAIAVHLQYNQLEKYMWLYTIKYDMFLMTYPLYLTHHIF